MKAKNNILTSNTADNSVNWKFFIDLIYQRAKAELRSEATRGYLGMLWWILEPMMYMGAFYVVFSHWYRRGDENYIFFLLTGLVVWKWFLATVITGASSLMANAHLMNQVYIPKLIFPLIAVVVNTVKFLIVLALFLIFLLIFTDYISKTWLFLPFIFFVQLLLITALTTFLSGLVPFIPDLRMILPNFMLMVFFLSGIFFDISTVPGKLQTLLYLNPMAKIISVYRSIVLLDMQPSFTELWPILLFSLMLLLIACCLLVSYDRIYPKIIH